MRNGYIRLTRLYGAPAEVRGSDDPVGASTVRYSLTKASSVASTQEVSLPQVVNDRLLEVPDYQRPYAWGPKQLADLWEDLDLLGPVGSTTRGRSSCATSPCPGPASRARRSRMTARP